MFALKKETDYAVQLLQYLGKKSPTSLKGAAKTFVSLMEFSRNSGISFWFLQKIARKLNLAGIIEAEQGVKGGYRLRALAKNLNLYKIFEIMEGKLAITPCLDCKNHICNNRDKKCGVQKITAKLNKSMIKMMQKVKIN
jgi:Rrf2 family protein